MKNLAIVTDIATNKWSLTTRHRRGLNVLYGNGGVKWVPDSAFLTYKNAPFASVAGAFANDTVCFTPPYQPLFYNDTGPANFPWFWKDLDRY
jgi:hypothetical protein